MDKAVAQGELIIRFSNDGRTIFDKYKPNKKPTTIIKEYTKFKITKSKCQSYLDIHCPELVINDEILNKCTNIFKLVFQYGDGYECQHGEAIAIWNEMKGWYFGMEEPLKIFSVLFNNDPLLIVCANPNDKYVNEKEYLLKDLLLDDHKYDVFMGYWGKKFNYLDLFKTVKDVSSNILKNSSHFKELPDEIINIILCTARDML